jgi:hypothetical protein
LNSIKSTLLIRKQSQHQSITFVFIQYSTPPVDSGRVLDGSTSGTKG